MPVVSVQRELEHTVSFELETGGAFAFEPGQFTMVYAFGVGEVPLSITGDPDDPGRLVHTVRRVGPVTQKLCAVTPGTVLGVRGPFGSSWPLHDGEGGDLLFVAGGIGLAPLRPAIHRALSDRHRHRFRNVVVLYGARTPEELLFESDLVRWGGRLDTTVLVTVDSAKPGWFGSVGVVTNLLRRAPYDPASTTAFVCGPEIMMRFTVKALVEEGLPAGKIHLSMERNMKCAIGTCGHCQFGRWFVCHDGPVFSYAQVQKLMWVREV